MSVYLLACNVQPDAVAGCPADQQVWMTWGDLLSFHISQVDPAIVAQAFGAGFILVGTIWAMSAGALALLSMLRG